MTVLKIDIDTRTLPRDYMARIQWTARILGWPLAAVGLRQTVHGWHVRVVVRKRLAPVSIVAAQVLMGSDPKRETFNLKRARMLSRVPAAWRKADAWNVLYRSHYRPGRVS